MPFPPLFSWALGVGYLKHCLTCLTAEEPCLREPCLVILFGDLVWGPCLREPCLREPCFGTLFVSMQGHLREPIHESPWKKKTLHKKKIYTKNITFHSKKKQIHSKNNNFLTPQPGKPGWGPPKNNRSILGGGRGKPDWGPPKNNVKSLVGAVGSQAGDP